MIHLTPLDAMWARVEYDSDDDSHVEQQLDDFLSFDSPGAAFSPAFKRGHWDGKIRLYKPQYRVIPAGLHDKVETWLKNRGIPVRNGVRTTIPLPTDQIDTLLARLNLGAKNMAPRNFQLKAFLLGLQNRKGVMISPTGSGKSLIFWLWAQYHKAHFDTPLLLIVPNLGLVKQMAKDFLEYGSKKSDLQTISGGKSTRVIAPIVIANWQGIYKLDHDWFEPFTMVLGDEVHLYQAKSIRAIMEKLVNAQYRLGLTGTLEGAKCHRLIIEGNFGPIREIESTANLQAKGVLAKLAIEQLILSYAEDERLTLYDKKADAVREAKKAKKKNSAGAAYQVEMEFVVSHPKRLTFTAKLAAAQPKDKNTLVLFTFKERHGIPLHDAILKLVGNSRPVYYVDGDVDTDVREQIRKLTEKQQGVIIVASYGVFSTGINIKNLHRIIFAGASKSKYRVLQGIGRGLRLHATKDKLIVFDLMDNLCIHSEHNFLFKHGRRRRKFYSTENFSVSERHIMLNAA